jgi:2,3-bisphosphoglycerate-independent phosphoglycerate mutase
MKYAVLVGDGMSDSPVPQLDGKTPLEAANIPNMDSISHDGKMGLVRTIPSGFGPDSYVGNLTLLGYDPALYFSGRSSVEAANIGVELRDKDVAFRCNFVTIVGDIMEDFSAGHLPTEQAAELIEALNKSLGGPAISFYTGTSYRHLLVVDSSQIPDGDVKRLKAVQCTPPHDISGQKVLTYLPRGEGSGLLRDLMEQAIDVLATHPANIRRMAEGRKPANWIWLWGQGWKPQVPPFAEFYGITGAAISAVDLVKGLAKCMGLEVIKVPGATGYLDTNYLGKAEYGLQALERHDFVYIHVEAPDEASHEGDPLLKVKAIEQFDELVVGTVLRGIKKFPEWRIMVTPDHMTSLKERTHLPDEVPFAMAGTGIERDNSERYSEHTASSSGLAYLEGHELMHHFIRG